ncbi:MAG TPA: hypothetical protein VGK41_08310, partial [Solirubrobacterales bacterium]
MATQLFLLDTTGSNPDTYGSGLNRAKANGSASSWVPVPLSTSRGAGVTGIAASTAAGPTSGLEVGSTPYEWVSRPLSADVTISGTITFNIWGSESSMSANAGFQVIVERLDHTGAIVSTVINSERGVELGTSVAVHNWTGSPTSTSFNKGDRIRIRVLANDAGGTMASGFTVNARVGGSSAAADGDSYVTFTENFSFLGTDPSTQTLYLTNTASDSGVSNSKKLWTTVDGSTTTFPTTTQAGWVTPIQVTSTAGGSVVAWYTPALEAFTLQAPILCRIEASETSSAANASIRVEVGKRTAGGTETVWGGNTHPNELTTSAAYMDLYVTGDDMSFADGDRLFVKVYLDNPSALAMVASSTVNMTGGQAGDSLIVLGQTLTEFSGAITLSPDPVATDVAVTAPTIGLGAIALAPAPVPADTNVTAPTLGLSIALAPAPVVTDTNVTAPTIGLGALALAPAPVPAVTAVPAPAVIAPIILTPAPVATSLAVPAPGLGLSLALAPAPVATPVAVTSPAIALALALAPAPVPADTNVTAPTIGLGAIALTPAPVPVVGAVTAPALGLSLALAPAPVAAVVTVPAPIVDVVGGGGTITLAPDPVATVAAVTASAIALGAITLAPDPVEAATDVAAPAIALSLSLAPDPVAADVVVTSPALGLGATTLAPAPVIAVTAVPAPTIVAPFTVTLAPAPVAVELELAQPFLVVIPPSGTG